MNTCGQHNEPCGLRLLRLISTQSLDIARRELENGGAMRLYGTGGYWTAFERSAYSLSRLFPELEAFVVNHPASPFSIVGVSVDDARLRRYMKSHPVRSRGADYLEFPASPFRAEAYGRWHASKVRSLGSGPAGRHAS